MAIQFNYKEKTYCLEFSYFKAGDKPYKTVVRLLEQDSQGLFHELFWDNAICHNNDNFNKEFGRKLALKRLLHQYTISGSLVRPTSYSREFRTACWQAYHNRKNCVQKSVRHLEKVAD